MYTETLNSRYNLTENGSKIYKEMAPFMNIERIEVVRGIIAQLNPNVGPWALYDDALQVAQEVARVEIAKRFAR